METYKTDLLDLRCCDNMDLMAKYPDKHFDLAVVDPPYGLGDSVVNSGGRFKRYENKNGNWDKEIPNNTYFEELFRVSKNQIIWGGNYFPLPTNKCFIIWDKKQPQGVSFAMAEYAWASFDKVAKIFYNRTQGQEHRFHPTQKPVNLYEWIFENFANDGDKILDTHLGSGSIAIASHYAGLHLTACEIDEDYFKQSVSRIERETAQQSLF